MIEGNGLRIWHAGDTVRYEGMVPKIRALGPMDAALLPINGRDAGRYRSNCIGNMTFQEAADAAGEVRPGLTMPGHWDMFAHNSENPEKFADYLRKQQDLIVSRRPRLQRVEIDLHFAENSRWNLRPTGMSIGQVGVVIEEVAKEIYADGTGDG